MRGPGIETLTVTCRKYESRLSHAGDGHAITATWDEQSWYIHRVTASERKMNPLSYDLGNALLGRHRDLCSKFTGNYSDVPESLVEEATISYRSLLQNIRAPESLAEGIGRYLEELAEWCESRKLPPINALAVNGQTRRPGAGYFLAPGCGANWNREVRECIACRSYPAEISN
jgi:hypothetical protein